MRTFKLLTFVSVAVTVPLMTLFWLNHIASWGPGAAERDEHTSAEVMACQLEAGQQAAFQLSSDVEAVGRGTAEAPHDHLSATLSWIVDSVESDIAQLTARLTDVEMTQSLSLPAERVTQSLDAPFEARLDRRCRFIGFGFAADWKPRTRQLVASLLKTFEFVAPERGQGPWTVEQKDGMGIFEARYTRGVPANALVRQKLVYRRHPMADMIQVRIGIGEARAEALMGDGWLTQVSGREQVTIEVADAEPVMLRQSFRLVRADEAFQAVAVAVSLDWRDPYDLPVEAAPRVDGAMKQVSYADVVADFASLRAQGPAHSLTAARLLSKYLRAHPADAMRLIDDVRHGALALDLRAAAFLALELAATPESVAALTVAVEDHQLTVLDRSRAAFALSEAGPVTPDTAHVLERAAYDDGSEMLANTGLLALGSFGARTREASEIRAWVRDSLRSAHEAAASEGRRLAVLDAMSNAADPQLFDLLGDAMNDERATVRAHAAAALRRTAPNSAGPWLQERLQSETHPRVQAELVRTLQRFGPPSGESVEMAGDLLSASESPRVRKALISWLGSAAASTEVRDLLVAHFHVEQEVGLLQLIGRFVPASAL